jgi:Uma2 family endonuclease
MPVPIPTIAQKWTYQDMLEKLPAETCAEILNNALYMSPAPSPEHQRVLKKFLRLIDAFVEGLRIGEVNIAPFDVILDQNNVVQPDLFFLTLDNISKVKAKGLEGSPDLIVEIISPSSFYRDTVEKKEQYEKYGVKEYWLVDPANKVIEVFSLSDDKYQLHAFVAESGKASSVLLAGFEINTSDLF